MLEGKLDGGEGAAFSGGSVAFKLQKGIDLPLDTGQKERLVVVISRSPEHESAIHVPRPDHHDVLPSRTTPAPPHCKRVRVMELSCGFGADRCDTSGITPFRGAEVKYGGDEAGECAPFFPVHGDARAHHDRIVHDIALDSPHDRAAANFQELQRLRGIVVVRTSAAGLSLR